MQGAILNLEKFNDPKEWDHVDYRVPVFVEHSLWEAPHPWKENEKVHVPVLPGEEPPQGATLLYSIGAKELESTAKKINDSLVNHQTPVGVSVGHRNQSLPENKQPAVVGYGVGASVQTFGKGQAIYLDRLCYIKGKYSEAKGYPHRSPEFKPVTGKLTHLALLRNDPKLPMGMMAYQLDEDTVCYGPNLMDEAKGGKDAAGAGAKEEEGDGEVPTGIQPKGTQQDPTKPPTAAQPDPAAHEEWRQHMEHYKRSDPMMLQMCKDYESKCAAAVTPEEGEEGEGEIPAKGPKPEGKKPAPPKEGEETENMASEQPTVNYADFQALSQKVDQLVAANTSLTTKYAESETNRYIEKIKRQKVVKDLAKLKAKFLGAADEAGRKAIFDEVMENYADREQPRRSPAESEDIEVYNEGGVEGSEKVDSFIDEMDMTAAVKYAEDNKLDMDADWDKIVKAIAHKNGKPVLAK